MRVDGYLFSSGEESVVRVRVWAILFVATVETPLHIWLVSIIDFRTLIWNDSFPFIEKRRRTRSRQYVRILVSNTELIFKPWSLRVNDFCRGVCKSWCHHWLLLVGTLQLFLILTNLLDLKKMVEKSSRNGSSHSKTSLSLGMTG